MIFWVDDPPEQWIYVREEPHNKHPWCVISGDFVRVRCTTELEAEEIAEQLRNVIRSAVVRMRCHTEKKQLRGSTKRSGPPQPRGVKSSSRRSPSSSKGQPKKAGKRNKKSGTRTAS